MEIALHLLGEEQVHGVHQVAPGRVGEVGGGVGAVVPPVATLHKQNIDLTTQKLGKQKQFFTSPRNRPVLTAALATAESWRSSQRTNPVW